MMLQLQLLWFHDQFLLVLKRYLPKKLKFMLRVLLIQILGFSLLLLMKLLCAAGSVGAEAKSPSPPRQKIRYIVSHATKTI